TFLAVFPDVTLWRNDFYPDRAVAGLVGRLAPGTVDLDRVAARIAALPEWSRDPLLATSRGLAMLYLGDVVADREHIGSGPLNTDDRPLIEFLAPRLTRMSAAGDKDWFTGDTFATFTDALASTPARALPATAAGAGARRAGPEPHR